MVIVQILRAHTVICNLNGEHEPPRPSPLMEVHLLRDLPRQRLSASFSCKAHVHLVLNAITRMWLLPLPSL